MHEPVELESVPTSCSTPAGSQGQIHVIIPRKGLVDSGVILQHTAQEHGADHRQLCASGDSIGILNALIGKIVEHMRLES
jgi:hypothetical protein